MTFGVSLSDTERLGGSEWSGTMHAGGLQLLQVTKRCCVGFAGELDGEEVCEGSPKMDGRDK